MAKTADQPLCVKCAKYDDGNCYLLQGFLDSTGGKESVDECSQFQDQPAKSSDKKES